MSDDSKIKCIGRVGYHPIKISGSSILFDMKRFTRSEIKRFLRQRHGAFDCYDIAYVWKLTGTVILWRAGEYGRWHQIRQATTEKIKQWARER